MTYAEKFREAKTATYGILAETFSGYPKGTGVSLKWQHTSKPGRRDQMHFWRAKMPNGRIVCVSERDLCAIWYRSAV
jgi:hypothetical protein